MATGLSVKEGGSWKEVQQPHVKVNGTWEACTAVYVKSGGTWVQVWPAQP